MIIEGVAPTASAVREGRTTAREVVAGALERIADLDGPIGAFVEVDPEQALADAEAVDLRHDRLALRLAGVPIAVKDLHDAAGYRTTYGSTLFADAEPTPFDSPIVARLRACGAVVVGKTNTPAFGWQPDTDGLLHGRTANPWDLSRSAGGSSGGSAAAVAGSMVALATGSDVGGSIRIPASLCGVAGFVPTAGRSDVTLGPGDGSMVRDGPIGALVADVALATAAIVEPGLRGGMSPPKTIGWSASPDGGPVDPQIAEVAEKAARICAERMGADFVDLGTEWEDPIDLWLPLAIVPMIEIRPPGECEGVEVEPGLAGLLDRFESMTGAEYAHVERAARAFGDRLRRIFRRVDLVVTPVTAGRAPGADGLGRIGDDRTRSWVRFTYPWNLTGCPVGTVPAGVDDEGMPIGIQIAGPRFGDEAVLTAMAKAEAGVGRISPPRPLVANDGG